MLTTDDPPAAKENVSGTVLRALSLLDLLVSEPGGMRLSDLARRSGLNKATAFRLLGSLQQGGLVTQDQATSRYRPSLKIIGMAERILEAFDLRAVARPHLEQLAGKTGYSVLAGVIEGAHVVYLEQVTGSNELRVDREVGVRRSIHISSIGKAIVAFLDPDERARVLADCRFERHTSVTITSRERFESDLAEVRQRGWASVVDEDILGASSVSAPIFDHSGRVAGAVGIGLPTVALRGDEGARYVSLLLASSRAVSEALGLQANHEITEGAG
jgi:DNA-binding IclR family transcriptional regulator